VQALRGRPRLRRAAILVNALAALVGVGLVAYPFATDAWARQVLQPRASAELRSPAQAAAYRSGELDARSAVTRLRIPALDVDVVVVEGITVSALRAGAGHYPSTPLPGQRGNVAIAGHRTTFGKPFRHLERMRVGDEILLDTPVGRFTYRVVAAARVVSPRDLTVLEQDQRARLTLTTCHPVDSARERLVVQAALVGEPADA
jgi:sortase A